MLKHGMADGGKRSGVYGTKRNVVVRFVIRFCSCNCNILNSGERGPGRGGRRDFAVFDPGGLREAQWSLRNADGRCTVYEMILKMGWGSGGGGRRDLARKI